jgi:hypothetical protein
MPSLSGKRLLMTQIFRDFFRSEVTGAPEGIAVRGQKYHPSSGGSKDQSC